jgi:hypothetical protein
MEAHLNGFGQGGNDLRSIMRGSDKVDIVTAHFLEPQHGLCHFREGDLLTPSEMADVIILAKDASKIAVSEEDGSRTVISYQRRFLAKMGKGT